MEIQARRMGGLSRKKRPICRLEVLVSMGKVSLM